MRTWKHTYYFDKYLEKLVKYNWLLKSWEWECEIETELVWSGILWWTNGHRPFRSQTEWFTRFSRGNIWWGIWWIFNPQEKTSTGNGKKWNARGRIYRSDVYIRFGITPSNYLVSPIQKRYRRPNKGDWSSQDFSLLIFSKKDVTVLIIVYLCSVFRFGIWCTHQQCPIFEKGLFLMWFFFHCLAHLFFDI